MFSIPTNFKTDTLQATATEKILATLSNRKGFFFWGNAALESESPFLASGFPTELIPEEGLLAPEFSPQPDKLLAGCLSYELGYALNPSLFPETTRSRRSLVCAYDWFICRLTKDAPIQLCISKSCHPTLAKEIRSLIAEAQQETEVSCEFHLKSRFNPRLAKQKYLSDICRVSEDIKNGIYYQMNYTQGFSASYEGSPWRAFKDLTRLTNAPFSCYLNAGDYQALSLSPERFISIKQRKVKTQPIKGTRPRSEDESQDRMYREELENSVKDRAENLMIVDLLRNDLGKFCETGSVTVTRLFDIESFKNVHHLVSTIEGRLRAEVDPLTALLSAFPGGSITGAPKLKAMETIKQLEGFERGPYCGSLFYAMPDGSLDSNIAIRTLVCENGTIYCYGGGGIVADSDAESEYQESVNKVRLFMESLEEWSGLT